MCTVASATTIDEYRRRILRRRYTGSYSSRHAARPAISINPDLIFADLRTGRLQTRHFWMLLDYVDLSRLSTSLLSISADRKFRSYVYWLELECKMAFVMQKNPS